jgi:hypothetical protein
VTGTTPGTSETRTEAPARTATFDAMVNQAFDAAAEAYMAASGGWAQSLHAALAALLDFLAGSPALTYLCSLEAAQDAVGLKRRDRALERFACFLQPGYAESAAPPPAVVAEAVIGGVYELVRTHAIAGRLETLGDQLPKATVIVLSPFVGNDEAERVAATRARV